MTELQTKPWFGALVGAWALLLLVLALVAYGKGDATVAEQRDIAAARDSADRVTVEAVAAAGQQAAARVGGFELVRRCEITIARDGVDYRRRITFFTRPGGEAALLRRIANRLPERHDPEFHDVDGAPRLRAYVDKFVEVRGTWGGARTGKAVLEIRTGCRPEADPAVRLRTPPTSEERAQAGEVFALVGAEPPKRPDWQTESVACGRDKALRTVRLTISEAPDRPLSDAAELVSPDASVLVSEERLLAYRQGGLSVVAEARGGTLAVTTTRSDC